jgi:molecular chaperone GrpE
MENETPKTEETPETTSEVQQAPEQPPKSEVEILNEKIADLEKQTAQFKDQVLRKAAEFENFKRRQENESLLFTKYVSENIITQLLPVLDDLSRSLKSGKEKFSEDPFYKGVEMIANKFSKVLETQGLKSIDCIGKEFNVEFHDALMMVPRKDIEPHIIVEEVEKGYVLYDKVIRHSKVIVSTTPVEEEVKK